MGYHREKKKGSQSSSKGSAARKTDQDAKYSRSRSVNSSRPVESSRRVVREFGPVSFFSASPPASIPCGGQRVACTAKRQPTDFIKALLLLQRQIYKSFISNRPL